MVMTLETPASLHGDDEPQVEQVETKHAEQDEHTEQDGSDASVGNDGATSHNDAGEEGLTSDPSPEHDNEFWRELEIIGEIAQAERDCQSCQREFDSLTADRKETKQELDAAQIRLRQATAKLVEHIGDREMPEKPASALDITRERISIVSESVDNWQAASTAELLKGVKGLGTKKLEAIVDAAPTAGDLEGLRGEASKQHKSFREVLPKGCGQGIADAIEDRLIEHVAKAGPPIAEQIAQREREELSQSLSTAIGAAGDDDDGEDGDEQDDTDVEDDDEPSEAHQPSDGEKYEDAE